MRANWRSWTAVFLSGAVLAAGGLRAQAEKPAAENKPAAEDKAGVEPFSLDQVIHPVVAALPAPEFYDPIVSMPMAISSTSPVASRHVAQGLAYIEAAWDFEAYRHFCAALKIDPDCVMAYWGIGLAWVGPNVEFSRQRQVAVLRMMDLMDSFRTVNGKKVALASPMEKQYALALAQLYSLKPGAGLKAFRELSKAFPNNLQAKCLAIYFQRDGYDEFGTPNFGQKEAIAKMEAIVNQNPENLGVLNFWVMLHAEAPEASTKLREQILPVVRKIARTAPDFPPYQHLLGHFEWRCGNHHLAEVAFQKAANLYQAHMSKNRLSIHECDGLIRAQLYLATAMHSRGRFEEAMKLALTLSKLKIDPERIRATGANLIVWEARTLPARLYLARGFKGDFARAIATLPTKGDPQLNAIKERSLSIFYLECLRQYLECRKSLAEGDAERALGARGAFGETLKTMKDLQSRATTSSSLSEYVRAVTGLEVYLAESRGLLAQVTAASDAERALARAWFKIAVEKQQRPALLMPPVVISPMELRLAEFYSRNKDLSEAAEAYQDALRRRPNDLVALQGYQQALLHIGREDDAERVGEVIKAVQKD